MNNNIISYYVSLIEDKLKKILEPNDNSTLKQSMKYSLLNGGKRLRPILFLSLLDSHNKNISNYLEVACAIEMVHTYSLVHDDLPAMDNDFFRRGKPTTHIKYNEAIAILCGDALLTDAFYYLTQVDVDKNVLIKLIRVLSLAAGSNGMVLGQELDIANVKDNNYDLKKIELVNYYKTTKMLEASIIMAAIINGDNLCDYIQLATYLGQAFQIQDDLLEYKKTSEELGKDNNSDKKNNKNTVVSKIGENNAQMLVENYFNQIDAILEKLNLLGTKFHLVILEIADRNM